MMIGNSDLTINTFVKSVYLPRVGYTRLEQTICHHLNIYCDVGKIMSVGGFWYGCYVILISQCVVVIITVVITTEIALV